MMMHETNDDEVQITEATVLGGWGEPFLPEYTHLQDLARAVQLVEGEEKSLVFPLRDPRWVGPDPSPAVYARYVGDLVETYWRPRFIGFPYPLQPEDTPQADLDTTETPPQDEEIDLNCPGTDDEQDDVVIVD